MCMKIFFVIVIKKYVVCVLHVCILYYFCKNISNHGDEYYAN